MDIARWVYVADTDAAAKRDTEQGIVRHISHFMGAGTAGYLGNVSEKNRAEGLTYDDLAATTLLHGSPATVIAKLRELRAQDRAHLAAAPLPALLRARQRDAEPAALRREGTLSARLDANSRPFIRRLRMEFGILFTSHPNHATEPYPHRAVHARVTAEIQAADRLGYDTAWVAEHHFSNQYGIMPDVFTYMGYLAAQTSRIRLGTAVVTVPLYDPIRVVENMAFVDILSGGRVVLGLGSGYRPYEFEGFGRDFDARRDVQEEAIDLILELLHTRRTRHEGPHFRSMIEGDYEIFPVSQQEPHPPLFMAGATERRSATRRGTASASCSPRCRRPRRWPGRSASTGAT